MVKKIVILIVIFIAGYFVVNYFKTQERVGDNPVNQENYAPTYEIDEPNNPSASESESLEKDYVASWIIVRDTDKLSLHSNLPEKLTSAELIEKDFCDSLVSGGFYSAEDKLLGLFISEGEILNPKANSNLLTGYFSVAHDGSFALGVTEPNHESSRVAIQSGPILIASGKPSQVSSRTEENARRIVVSETQKGEIAFLSVYSKSSNLLGPTLTELPKILDNIQKTRNMKFKNAINLDGGSHSAFITKNLKLSEISKIGSYFCIKP